MQLDMYGELRHFKCGNMKEGMVPETADHYIQRTYLPLKGYPSKPLSIEVCIQNQRVHKISPFTWQKVSSGAQVATSTTLLLVNDWQWGS